MSVVACVGLGSNLGARETLLREAFARLAALPGVSAARLSSLFETDPVGGPAQGAFLNAAARLDAEGEPRAFLTALLSIEASLGRVRRERWGPRAIDLDLLLWGDRVVSEEGLSVPHPRLAERPFVLVPLAEVVPEARHPVLGRTVRELLAAAGAEGVRPWSSSGARARFANG